MKKIFLPAAILFSVTAKAQFYFKDVISSRQTMDLMKLYKKNKVKNVVLQSFEADGKPTSDFDVSSWVEGNYNKLKTFTSHPVTGKSMLVVNFTGSGLMTRSSDSSRTVLKVNQFEYDSSKRLRKINNTVDNYDSDFKSSEKHEWYYNDKGPDNMICIKYTGDTLLVKFTLDEKGNVIEEKQYQGKLLLEQYYYYYDDAGRLTDIVRYNDKLKKLLPDYLFNYDEKGQLSEMISVESGSRNYQDWRYEYDEKGLKTKDTCYGKKKEYIGRVEYKYEMNEE